jgi:endoglycosylceramidase
LCDEGNPKEGNEEICMNWHYKRIGIRNEDAKRLGIPFILSEFGACIEGKGCETELTQVTEVSDVNLTSWAYWEFKTYRDLTTIAADKSEGFYRRDGSLILEKARALTRPYISAAQGQILYMRTSKDRNTFIAKILVDSSISKPTEMYLNEDYWFKSADNNQNCKLKLQITSSSA